MRLMLEDLPAFYFDCDLQPVKGDGRRSSERGLGVRLDALDYVAGFDVLPALEEWERDWRKFFGLVPFGVASTDRLEPATALAGVVGFLIGWLDKACAEHPAIDEFSKELAGLWRQAQSAAGQQPRTSWRVTCPADTADGECGNAIRITGEDFDGSVECRKCHTAWPVERLLRVAASSNHAELWLDPEAAATWFGVPARELRRWAQAGKIKRANGRYESHSIREAISGSIG